jgi:predicted component of type VI protein secretion system
MKYPFHTQSMPVVGFEAQRLINAIEHDNYVTNDAAMATAQRIVERRKTRELADVTRR